MLRRKPILLLRKPLAAMRVLYYIKEKVGFGEKETFGKSTISIHYIKEKAKFFSLSRVISKLSTTFAAESKPK